MMEILPTKFLNFMDGRDHICSRVEARHMTTVTRLIPHTYLQNPRVETGHFIFRKKSSW